MRKPMTEEEKELICKLYNSGVSRNQIILQLHRTDKTIKRVLEEKGCHIRGIQESNVNKYSIDQEYFEIENQKENTAYILGMLASDGCVASNENCIYIELQREDREILEKINAELKNERPVKDYHNNSKNYDNSKLYFFSKKIKEDLALYNIIPNKTHFNNDFMENIKEEYEIDYIRGHFDGDGSVKWVNGTIEWQIDSTSLKTLTHMQTTLKKYGIEAKIILHQEECQGRNRTIDLYRLYFYGFENNLKLFHLFYNNPNSLKMERKHKHYYDLLMKYNVQEASVLDTARQE